MATAFKTQYTKEVVPALQKEFGYPNAMAVPRVTKIIVSVGINATNKDPKIMEVAEATLQRITGQKPVKTLAKKSISNFKIRKGMTVGLMVTLRGARMNDFLTKLLTITLPRVRDFHGISDKAMDARGSLTIGFREHISFPEIRPDEVERVHGLGVTIVTTATSKKEGLALLKHIGIPFAAKA